MLFNLLLQEPRDEWKAFWKSQLSPSPLVTKIALLVLSTSAEATPSERTFSVAWALSKRRGGGKLKPGTLSSLTMLQRVTRNRLEGKTRLTRAKRLKPMATKPLATQPLAAVVAPLSATAEAMDTFDEFEARLQVDAKLVEAMINKGELAFITVGDDGDLELLEQDPVDLELLLKQNPEDANSGDDDDDDCSLDILLSVFSGGAAVKAVGSQQPGSSLMSPAEVSEVPRSNPNLTLT